MEAAAGVELLGAGDAVVSCEVENVAFDDLAELLRGGDTGGVYERRLRCQEVLAGVGIGAGRYGGGEDTGVSEGDLTSCEGLGGRGHLRQAPAERNPVAGGAMAHPGAGA